MGAAQAIRELMRILVQNSYLVTVSWTAFRRYNLCSLSAFPQMSSRRSSYLLLWPGRALNACRAEHGALFASALYL